MKAVSATGLTDAVSAFANCGRTVAQVPGSYVPNSRGSAQRNLNSSRSVAKSVGIGEPDEIILLKASQNAPHAAAPFCVPIRLSK